MLLALLPLTIIIMLMQSEQKTLESLIEEITTYFKVERKVADHTILRYKTFWRKLKEYLASQNIGCVNPDVLRRFINYSIGDKQIKHLTANEKTLVMVIKDLIEFTETKSVLRLKETPHKLDGPIGELMAAYINGRFSQRVAKQTLYMYELYLSQFLCFLKTNNVSSIKDVTQLQLLNYLKQINPQKEATTKRSIIVLRGFFAYLYAKQVLEIDFSRIIPRSNYKMQAKLPSTYSKGEIVKLISSVDRASPVGKRNYAIILLAAQLGLRASDIANLKFNNLNWRENTIRIEQFKTESPLELPLLAEVGNAIIDYLRFGRPKSNKPFVFLIAMSPYDELLPTSIYTIVKNAFGRTDINTQSKKRGPHALRHSLAGHLLETKTILPVIAEVLGHENTESTRYYLRIDLQSLQCCALEVPLVPTSFYTQKGGYFYE